MCIILSLQNLNLCECWIKHLGAGQKNRRANINLLWPLSMALTRQLVQCTISHLTPVIWNGHSGLRELTNVPDPRSCGLGKVHLHILPKTSGFCWLIFQDVLLPQCGNHFVVHCTTKAFSHWHCLWLGIYHPLWISHKICNGCNDKYFQDLLHSSGNFYSIVWFGSSNWFSKNFEVVNQEPNPNSSLGWFGSGWFSSAVHSLVWQFRTDPGQH